MFILCFVQRVAERLVLFLRHFYLDSFYLWYENLIKFLKKLDRHWALKITLKHFWQPLYQDYTWHGYLIGVSFRLFRVIVSSITYLIIILFSGTLYLLWCAILPYIIYNIFK